MSDILTSVGELLTSGTNNNSKLVPTPIHEIHSNVSTNANEILKEMATFIDSIIKNDERDVQSALNAQKVMLNLAKSHLNTDFDVDNFLRNFETEIEKYFSENIIANNENREIIQKYFEQRKSEIIKRWEYSANLRKEREEAESELQKLNEQKGLFGVLFAPFIRKK